MLVLTRKDDESIIIGNNIEIKILKSENGKVRVGIEAPQNIEINRKEIYEEIQRENKKAVNKVSDVNKLRDIYKNNKNK